MPTVYRGWAIRTVPIRYQHPKNEAIYYEKHPLNSVPVNSRVLIFFFDSMSTMTAMAVTINEPKISIRLNASYTVIDHHPLSIGDDADTLEFPLLSLNLIISNFYKGENMFV